MAMNPQKEVIKQSVWPWNENGSAFPLHTALVKLYFTSTSYAAGAGGADTAILYLQGVNFQAQRQVQPVTELGSWKLYNVPMRTMATMTAQRALGSSALTNQVGRYFKKMELKSVSAGATINVPTLTLWHGRIASAGLAISVGQAVMMENVTFIGDITNWSQSA